MNKEKYLDVLISNIFTGAQADAIIAILLVVCILLFALLWIGVKLFLKREKQHREDMLDVQKSLQDTNEKLRDTLTRYMDFAKATNEQYNEAARETLNSYHTVSVTMTEVKTLLNTLLLYRTK